MLNTALFLSHRIIVPSQLSVLADVSPREFSFASISTFKTPETPFPRGFLLCTNGIESADVGRYQTDVKAPTARLE